MRARYFYIRLSGAFARLIVIVHDFERMAVCAGVEAFHREKARLKIQLPVCFLDECSHFAEDLSLHFGVLGLLEHFHNRLKIARDFGESPIRRWRSGRHARKV